MARGIPVLFPPIWRQNPAFQSNACFNLGRAKHLPCSPYLPICIYRGWSWPRVGLGETLQWSGRPGAGNTETAWPQQPLLRTGVYYGWS